MYGFLALGARIEDVLVSVKPAPRQQQQEDGDTDIGESVSYRHWVNVRSYYQRYEHFLTVLQNATAGYLTMVDDKMEADYAAAGSQLRDKQEETERLMATYINGEDADQKLESIWDERIALYRVLRDVLQHLISRYDLYEDIFVFETRLRKFWDVHKTPGAQFLQGSMKRLVEVRSEFVSDLYQHPMARDEVVDSSFTRLALLERQIDVRLGRYERDEELRVLYGLLARNTGTGDTDNDDLIDQVRELLEQMYDLLAGTAPDNGPKKSVLEVRVAARNLMLEAQRLTGQLSSVLRVLYRPGGRLIFAGNNGGVTTRAPLRLPQLDRTLLALRQVAQRDLLAGEVITASRRLIALVPANVDTEALFRSDMQRLLVANMSRGADMFDEFRPDEAGNCRVYQVVVEGQQLDVLVATRAIKRDEPLLRDYSDAELYRMWLRFNDTTATAPLALTLDVDTQRVRQRIADLQLARLRLSATTTTSNKEQQLTDIDLRVRINFLNKLLVVVK
jgi:hypothetical protein